MPRHQSDLAKTSCQNASEGMYSGSQCQASSTLQGAKQQGRTALSVMQAKLDGARRRPAKQRQHKHMGLHFDQHVGVPQQAVLACRAIVQGQKCSETEVRRGTQGAGRDPCESHNGSGSEPGRCAICREIAIKQHSNQGRATSVPSDGAMHEVAQADCTGGAAQPHRQQQPAQGRVAGVPMGTPASPAAGYTPWLRPRDHKPGARLAQWARCLAPPEPNTGQRTSGAQGLLGVLGSPCPGCLAHGPEGATAI